MSARRDRTISKEVNATVIKKDLRSAGMCLAERLVFKTKNQANPRMVNYRNGAVLAQTDRSSYFQHQLLC